MKKIFIIFASCIMLQGCWETQNGQKVGTIVKIAKQGVLFGTNEAELIRGGMSNGSGSFGKAFYFTISNDFLLIIANQALESQQEVKIQYHKEGIYLPWRSESDGYFLDKIEIIK